MPTAPATELEAAHRNSIKKNQDSQRKLNSLLKSPCGLDKVSFQQIQWKILDHPHIKGTDVYCSSGMIVT